VGLLQRMQQQQAIAIFYPFNLLSFFIFLLWSFYCKELLIIHQNLHLTMLWAFF
jgi:hypothetical protein